MNLDDEKTLKFAASIDDLTKFFSQYVHEYNTGDLNRDVSEYAIRAALEDYFERFGDRTDLTLNDLIRTMTIKYRFYRDLDKISPESLPVNWRDHKKYAFEETIDMILAHEEYIDNIISTAHEWVVVTFPNNEHRDYTAWAKNRKSYRIRVKIHDIKILDDEDDSARADVTFSLGDDKWIYMSRQTLAEAYGVWNDCISGFTDPETKYQLTFEDLHQLESKAKEGNLILETNCVFQKDHIDRFDTTFYKVILTYNDKWLSEFFMVKGSYFLGSLVPGQEIPVEEL